MSLQLVSVYEGRVFEDAVAGVARVEAKFKTVAQNMPMIALWALTRYLTRVQNALLQKHSTPWSWPNAGPDKLATRSGTALRSMREYPKIEGGTAGTAGDIVGRIGGIWYLATHEYGATIRPKNAKFLTVPLPDALDSRGVPLKPRARDWPNTFVAKSKRGNLLIFQRRGKNIVPLYYLAKSVRIPRRLGMRAQLNKEAPTFAAELAVAIRKEFFGGGAIQ